MIESLLKLEIKTSLRAGLQMDKNLTLEDAKWKVRQCEAVQEHQKILKGGPKTETVVDSVYSRKNKFPTARKRQEQSQSHSASNEKCTWCGKGPHTRQECSAKEVVCHRTHDSESRGQEEAQQRDH